MSKVYKPNFLRKVWYVMAGAPKVATCSVSLGCDPEFFFSTKEGETIGSEKVLTQDFKSNYISYGVIIDGVQAELNPAASTCRESLAHNIIGAMQVVKSAIQHSGNKITTDFSSVVKISKKELESLSEKSQQFGCAPSKNLYDTQAKITTDPKKYLKRSAGGHIHLGFYDEYTRYPLLQKEGQVKLVALLDLLVGIPGVLLDQDKGNKERRKNYGRAGEYRTPRHGVEYRVLSNFWLRGYPIYSIIFGLARQCVHYIGDRRYDYHKAFTDLVKQEDVIEAINNNDFDQAMMVWKKVEPLLLETTSSLGFHSLGPTNIEDFHYLIKKGPAHFINNWNDPLVHWLHLGASPSKACPKPDAFHGACYFLQYNVGVKRRQEEEIEKKTKPSYTA